MDKDIIYIAGLLAGDGDIRKEKSGSYSVRLSNETAELQEFFRKILKERFSLKFGVTKGNEKRPLKGNEKASIIINESGMYSLIFGSKLTVAKEFKRFI